jgi:hypothetical protein
VQTLRAAEDRGQGLQRNAHDVDFRLCAVKLTPEVCACVRSIHERGSFAPYFSRIVRAQMRRAARNLAISSKNSL